MAEDTVSNNKRIAKNTLMLYIRMFVAMIVGLYTSRVVLNTLGVEDYGIYAIVGGFISMMSFLNASMSGATSRFITFELGKGNMQRLKDTFSSAMLVHIGIALIVLIAGETIGLWFFMNKLVIPEARMDAALWVYHLSIVSMMISICQVPYNACIIAHEKMDAYAYIEIANTLLKLVIVYILLIGDYDKLILYGWLTLGVSTIIFITYRFYGRQKFNECKFRFVWNKEILKPLLTFSGLDLYGYGCSTAKQQVSNILINIFFGVVFNAASGIATTVNAMVSGFAKNITTAFKPQIIKCYSVNHIDDMQYYMNIATKYTLILYSCFCIPLLIELDYVLKLWLVNVPEYTSEFCSLLLITSTIGLTTGITNSGIHATGDIKYLSFISGSLYLIQLPIIYILFKFGKNAVFAYYIDLLISIIVLIVNTFILKKQIRQINIRRLYSTLFIPIVMIISIYGIVRLTVTFFEESIFRLIFTTGAYIILVIMITYKYILEDEIKTKIKDKIKKHNA